MIIINDLTIVDTLDKERQKNESLQIAQACVSHEMKTPLKTMKMYSDHLLRDCNKSQEEMLHSIKIGSQLLLFNVMTTLDCAQLDNS
jgi:signal transduction histidine kinase